MKDNLFNFCYDHYILKIDNDCQHIEQVLSLIKAIVKLEELRRYVIIFLVFMNKIWNDLSCFLILQIILFIINK